MPNGFLPLTDNELLAFCSNFSALLLANYAAYGISNGDAQTYGVTFNDYKTALAAAQAGETRGKASIFAKKQAKTALLESTRAIARMLSNSMVVTDTQRLALGLTIRKVKPTLVPTPGTQPALQVVSVSDRVITLAVRNADSTKKAKPSAALYANIYTYVSAQGETAPSDPAQWQFDGPATRSSYTIAVPDDVPAGSVLSVTAAWVNRRGESGPSATPVSTYVQFGPVMPVQTEAKRPTIKIAA